MKKAAGLLVACGLCLLVASSASAALPEIGRCEKVEGVKEGHKKVFSGKYTDKTCTRESTSGRGKYEWSAGPGEEKQFESPGTLEPVTLETTAGKQIACANSKQVGELTGAKTETTEISLYECKEVASGEPCQSLRPEETPPTPAGRHGHRSAGGSGTRTRLRWVKAAGRVVVQSQERP